MALAALAPYPTRAAHRPAARLALLLELLRERRCLLVLDSWRPCWSRGRWRGDYRTGYEGYGEVLRQVAESEHQSSLLLTGREAPPELAPLAGAAPVRMLRLGGLDLAACRALLQSKGLVGDDDAWQALVARYGGNPLALSLVGQTIVELFGGEIDGLAGLRRGDGGAVFGGMRRLLEEQVGRLSALEQSLLYWLAVEREPVGVAALRADLGPGAGRGRCWRRWRRWPALAAGAGRERHPHPAAGGAGVCERAAGGGPGAGGRGGRPVLLVSQPWCRRPPRTTCGVVRSA